METDIILEGFQVAEKTHGVRYMRFVRDGDSSVYPTLFTLMFQNGITALRRLSVRIMHINVTGPVLKSW